MKNNKYMIFKTMEGIGEAKRKCKEEKHEFRTKFDRDRDRILYSKAFRRLSGKTQVFVTGHEDHIRTRLTHTLEVSQIAKTIASYFGLDIALTEAIALGHDIGHTPFGHEGERILNFVMNGFKKIKEFNNNIPNEEKGFKHNWQSVRVLTQLEKKSELYDGLNLTNYTLWGILNHSKLKWEEPEDKLKVDFYRKNSNVFINDIINNRSWTFEGLVVRQADEIAQRHHDIEDGILANLIDKNDVIEKFKKCFENTILYNSAKYKYKKLVKEISGNTNSEYDLPLLSRIIVDFLSMNLIKNIEKNFNQLISGDKYNIKTEKDFYDNKYKIFNEDNIFRIVNYNKKFSDQEKIFKEYLENRILYSFKTKCMDAKAEYIIRKLFKAYLNNPQQLPDKTIASFYGNYDEKNVKVGAYLCPAFIGDLRKRLKTDYIKKQNNKKYKNALLRTICDYISGMTDNYALDQYELLYGTKQRELREFNL